MHHNAVQTHDNVRRLHGLLANAPMPTSYTDLCSGLTESGVTKLTELEDGVISFGTQISSSNELQHQLRPPTRAGAQPIAMTTLEAVAIHLFILDKWEDPARSVHRVINMAVSKKGRMKGCVGRSVSRCVCVCVCVCLFAKYIFSMYTCSLNFPASQQLFFQDWRTLELCSPYLKCLISGLQKLKRREATVFRGAMGDMRKHYITDSKIFWWNFNPCTTNIQSLDTDIFLGRKGKRTIFTAKTGLLSMTFAFSIDGCCGDYRRVI